MIQCLFELEDKTPDEENPETGHVRLTACVGDEQEWAKFTPFGKLGLGLLNPQAFAEFVPGAKYRVLVERIDETEVAGASE